MSPEEPAKQEKPTRIVLPNNTCNTNMAILRNIYPDLSRRTLRAMLKKKSFMKSLNIRKIPRGKTHDNN